MNDNMHDPNNNSKENTPDILAPAGDTDSFLAAIAAGADAVYCGLKHFSARMEARNFSLGELASLSEFAREKGKKTLIALNTLIKPGEEVHAAKLIARLEQDVHPEAIIASDPAMSRLAREVGFSGEMHLSTLGTASTAWELDAAKKANFTRIVLPRELTIDEIKEIDRKSPVDLELFVHGALCYGISGRCYWSSLLGGKSGLRGRCVQPCRREYTYKGHKGQYFSCKDLSLDVLTKLLLQTNNIRALKIEGRKKGPHYVYHTVYAYRLLRDRGNDPKAKKDASSLLNKALGRPGTHYYFLPHRPFNPTDPGEERTSGLFVGVARQKGKNCILTPRVNLIQNDLLRIGSEGESNHATLGIKKNVPAKGRFNLPKSPGENKPVYLIDRQEPELVQEINKLKNEMPRRKNPSGATGVSLERINPARPFANPIDLHIYRCKPGNPSARPPQAFWADIPRIIRENLQNKGKGQWIWLPPNIWPQEESTWIEALASLKSCPELRIVLGSLWQTSLLPPSIKADIWAGPFCNLANARSVSVAAELGCHGAFPSVELGGKDLYALGEESPLPLGIVLRGLWPACISRIPASGIRPATPVESPKGEIFWSMRYGGNHWIFPNWHLDLTPKREELQEAGFSVFAHIQESVPRKINLKDRPGLWNFEHGLL